MCIEHVPLATIHLQDAPRDIQVPCTVTCAKPGQPGGTCLRCSYVHRGSFKGITLTVLQQQMREYPQLKDKCSGLSSLVVEGMPG